jgi:ABC-type Zn uptake system ZnuABC Zn-binding protein ZnuA
LAALLLWEALFLGVGSGQPKPVVTASLFPVADMVRCVGHDSLEVVLVLPPGTSPHGFEPTPETARRVAQASGHFIVGLGLDDWLAPFLRAAGLEAARIFRVGEAVEVARWSEIPPQEDPHLWMDPRLAAAMGQAVALFLEDLFPQGRATWRRGARAWSDSMAALEQRMRTRLAACLGTPMVGEHGVWKRLAERFGLDLVDLIEPYPGQEPSARRLQQLMILMKQKGVRLVLVEVQGSDRIPRVLSLETGARIVRLDPVGGSGGSDTYAAAMMRIASTLASACSEDGGSGGR